MLSNGDWEWAADFLATHVERWPGDYRLRYLLGVAQEEIGDELMPAAESFLAVMAIDQELPSVKNTANTPTRASYYQELTKIAPPGMDDLLQTVQLGYTVYSHRQRRNVYLGSHLSSSMAYGAMSQVAMPGDLQAAHRYALMHVASILPLLEEDQAETVRETALRAGLPAAEVVLTVERRGNSWQLDPKSAIEAFPENDAVLAYAAIASSGTQLDAKDVQEGIRAAGRPLAPACAAHVYDRYADQRWFK